MKTDEKEKKKSILPKILIGGVVLAGAVVITGLLRNNIKLRKQNWNYEGQLKIKNMSSQAFIEPMKEHPI